MIRNTERTGRSMKRWLPVFVVLVGLLILGTGGLYDVLLIDQTIAQVYGEYHETGCDVVCYEQC